MGISDLENLDFHDSQIIEYERYSNNLKIKIKLWDEQRIGLHFSNVYLIQEIGALGRYIAEASIIYESSLLALAKELMQAEGYSVEELCNYSNIVFVNDDVGQTLNIICEEYKVM